MQGFLCPCAGALPAASTVSHSRCLHHLKPCAPLQPQLCRPSLAAPQQIWRSTRGRLPASASPAAAPAGRLLASSVISAFIPRQDLIDQLLRWAHIEAQDQGVVNFGLPMTVRPTYRNEDELWGFSVTVHSREGEELTKLSVRMDEETITKHEYVGRGVDGFPIMKGKSEDVEGRALEIRCGTTRRCFVLPSLLDLNRPPLAGCQRGRLVWHSCLTCEAE